MYVIFGYLQSTIVNLDVKEGKCDKEIDCDFLLFGVRNHIFSGCANQNISSWTICTKACAVTHSAQIFVLFGCKAIV